MTAQTLAAIRVSFPTINPANRPICKGAYMSKSTSQIDTFLNISAWLTGFDVAELQGTGMVETYFETVAAKNTVSDVDYFYAEADAILHETAGDERATVAQIRSRLIPDSCYNSLAKNIILMWYTGEWYTQTDEPGAMTGTQINGESYVQGLMWTAAETHPPGAKQPGYGSWAKVPIGSTGHFVEPK